MKKQYDKNRLVNNIEYLLKRRNVKVGDLENQCGVSTGYISRLKNNDNNDTSPSAEVLLRLSIVLNVSLTSLLYSDYEKMTETELFLQSFLADMINKTESNKVLWDRFSQYSIYNETYGDGETPLPIAGTYQDSYGNNKTYYYSLFAERPMTINGYYYTLFLNNNLYYLISLYDEIKGRIFELYILLANQSFKKICCSDIETHTAIRQLLTDLYSSVERSCKQVRIDEDVKNSLEDFLSSKGN